MTACSGRAIARTRARRKEGDCSEIRLASWALQQRLGEVSATLGAFRALPKYTRRGWPDICLIRASEFYGIEVKSETSKLSDEQKNLGTLIEKNGGHYIVARSIDDLQEKRI